MDSSLKTDNFKMIEEQIKDNNVVTFKSLSRKLNVHNTIAKQLLQEFLDNATDKNKYVATLVVYGKKNDGDLLLSLVKESELPALKSDISVIDQHIYSIQLSDSTFDPDMIYNIDKATFELKQLSLSSIKYNKEIIRKSVTVQTTPTPAVEPHKSSPFAAKATPQPTREKEKPEAKKQESPPSENSSAKSNKDTNSKTETKKSIVKPLANNKGSISSFFQKQAAKGAAKKTNTSNGTNEPEKSIPNGKVNGDSDDQKTSESDASKSEPTKKENSSINVKQSPETSKIESTLVTDGLAKKIEQKGNTSKKSQKAEKSSKSKKSKSKKSKQKKMKRIILNSDSSSNSEASEDESHYSEPDFDDMPEPVPEPPKQETPAVIVTHGKKRKRKIIEKTVMDDEGYLHTNKEVVYETCSSDENDDQNNENLDTNKRIKTEETETDKAKISKNEDIAKSQTSKTKQSSIMSFFKKPQKT